MSDTGPVVDTPAGSRRIPDRIAADLWNWFELAASVASAATTVEDAFRNALDVVCDRIGWPLGHVLALDRTSGRLHPVAIWHDDDPPRHREFLAASANLALSSGAGLPGRVMAEGRPVWITDVRADARFVRRAAAERDGIGAAIGVPIVGADGLEGVLEFFAHHALPRDDGLLRALAHVGTQLGGVADRLRAHEALHASERRLRALVEGAPDALFVVDGAGHVVMVNAEAERLSGYGRDELVGLDIEVLVPEPARPVHVSDRIRYGAHPRRRGMGVGRDLYLRRRDGTTIPVDIALSPLEGDAPGPIVTSVRDLSERRRAEEALRLSNARLEEAEHLARIGSWSWEVDSDAVTWSPELRRLYGLGSDEEPLAFPDYMALVHPDDRHRVQEAVSGCVSSLRPFEHEYRITTRGGEQRWVHAYGAVVVQRAGQAVRLAGYCRDVTDTRRAEDLRNQALADLDQQHRVLERIARGDPMAATVAQLCPDVERRCPGAMVSVLLVDEMRRCTTSQPPASPLPSCTPSTASPWTAPPAPAGRRCCAGRRWWWRTSSPIP